MLRMMGGSPGRDHTRDHDAMPSTPPTPTTPTTDRASAPALAPPAGRRADGAGAGRRRCLGQRATRTFTRRVLT
jgi:hypothetical protein